MKYSPSSMIKNAHAPAFVAQVDNIFHIRAITGNYLAQIFLTFPLFKFVFTIRCFMKLPIVLIYLLHFLQLPAINKQIKFFVVRDVTSNIYNMTFFRSKLKSLLQFLHLEIHSSCWFCTHFLTQPK